jgi:P27 family predicted phage terminase small subunit
MGRRGPAPQPVPLKILKGRGHGLDQAGLPIPAVPKFERAAPEPPVWLADEARELWTRVAPSLDRLELLKCEDREVFAAYCTAWARFVTAVKLYQTEGLTRRHPTTGHSVTHPAVKIAETAGRDLLRFAQDFGLTPSAEINLAASPKVAAAVDDAFAGGAS